MTAAATRYPVSHHDRQPAARSGFDARPSHRGNTRSEKAGGMNGRKVSRSPSRKPVKHGASHEEHSPTSPIELLSPPLSGRPTTSDGSPSSTRDSLRSRAGSDPSRGHSGGRNLNLSPLQLSPRRASSAASKQQYAASDVPSAVIRAVSVAPPFQRDKSKAPDSQMRASAGLLSTQEDLPGTPVLDDSEAAAPRRAGELMEDERKASGEPKDVIKIGNINATYDKEHHVFELKGLKKHKARLTKTDIDHIKNAYPKMARLNLHYCHFSADAINALSRHTHISILDLTGCDKDSDANFNWLQRLPQLKGLVLASWSSIKLTGAVAHRLSQLEELDYSGVKNLDDDEIGILLNFKSLRQLTISKTANAEVNEQLEMLRGKGLKIVEKSNAKRNTDLRIATLTTAVQGLSLEPAVDATAGRAPSAHHHSTPVQVVLAATQSALQSDPSRESQGSSQVAVVDSGPSQSGASLVARTTSGGDQQQADQAAQSGTLQTNGTGQAGTNDAQAAAGQTGADGRKQKSTKGGGGSSRCVIL